MILPERPLCFVHVKQYGRVAYGPKYFHTEQLGNDFFMEGDTSDLYDLVIDMFPQNEWDDIVCDDVFYYDDHVDINVSTYTVDVL